MERLAEDIRSVKERDPAARSLMDVLLCYPGLHAVWGHRMTHALWRAGLRLPARVLAQCVRFATGIEIHPAAQLGRRLFIDHGFGVVIGETAVVGDDVTLYQGVTLGGTGKERGKRHPTLCDRVFVGNNANILGDITIGENSRVGAGSVVLQDVPPNSTVVGVPAHIIYREGRRVLITDPREVKDPLSDAVIALSARVEELEARLHELRGEQARKAGQHPLTAEVEERTHYRQELHKLRDYVNMGEGI
ncbi:MAG TPA: serine O-acetyltransferase [Acidobacteriaceae bacterium]|nr:serine O-acetyltransferase [Acidobacteriaceae bacterium]